ncbi:hypothetical protein T08_8622 [Trichinella sp. T8]|nr:hypothetical protein T08_8622 [Trichinella sp. T8]
MEKAQAVHHPTRFLRTQQLGRLNFALLFLSQLKWHLIDHSACLDTRYYCPMYSLHNILSKIVLFVFLKNVKLNLLKRKKILATYPRNGRVISCVLLVCDNCEELWLLRKHCWSAAH